MVFSRAKRKRSWSVLHLVALAGLRATFEYLGHKIAALSPIDRSNSPEGVKATLPLRQSPLGSAGSFLVAADDQNRYWSKPLNNLQSSRVPITEQVVGRLGELIGAAVCKAQLVSLDGLAGWEFRPGRSVELGWAHGSLAVGPALETRSLEDRSADDNRRRQAGFFALHDWLIGGDDQWLYDTSADNMYYSHDHGFYLAGPDWTEASLAHHIDDEAPLPEDDSGLDPGELGRLAEALDGLGREEIEREVSKIPVDWPVSDAELAAVVDFAGRRRAPVAGRLRALVP